MSDERLRKLEEKVDRHSEVIQKLEVTIKGIARDLSEIKSDLKDFIDLARKQAVTQVRLDNVERRVESLDDRLTKLEDKQSERMWQVIRHGIVAVISGIVGFFFAKFGFK